MSFQRLKAKILIYTIVFILALVGIDRFLFSYLYFLFPNEMEWDTSHWYNFLHKKKSIDRVKHSNKTFIVGSSVAMYSALPEQIEAKLKQNSIDSKVDFYAHVAMSPMDFYYYADDIVQKKPKTILYLLNPVDFQFDSIQEKDGRVFFSEGANIQEYVTYRSPVKMFYPERYLWDHLEQLSKKDIFSLTTKIILYANRYRSFFDEPFSKFIERHYRAKRSYHIYTGVVPDTGIGRHGWTTQEFNIQCKIKDGKFNESLFIPKENSTLTIQSNDQILFQKHFAKSTWTTINLDLKTNLISLHFSIDKTIRSKEINPKERGQDMNFGIRLNQNFCKDTIEKDLAYLRTDSLEDSIYANLTIEEYKEDYQNRMYKDKDVRGELLRLNRAQDIKKKLSNQTFTPWSEFLALKKLAMKLRDNQIRFIVINNPENPIELTQYKDGQWYKGYLEYLSSMDKEGLIRFYDLKEYLTDVRDFVDPHHLTYKGSVKMTEPYTKIIKENKLDFK